MADPSFSTLFSRDNLVNPQIPTPTDEQLEQTYGEVNQDTVNQEYTNNVITLLSNLQTAVDPTGVMSGNTMANPELIGQAFDYYKTQPGMGLMVGAKVATDFASSVGANALNQVNRIGSEEEIPVFDPGLEYADVFANSGYDEDDAVLLGVATSFLEPGPDFKAMAEAGAMIPALVGLANIFKRSGTPEAVEMSSQILKTVNKIPQRVTDPTTGAVIQAFRGETISGYGGYQGSAVEGQSGGAINRGAKYFTTSPNYAQNVAANSRGGAEGSRVIHTTFKTTPDKTFYAISDSYFDGDASYIDGRSGGIFSGVVNDPSTILRIDEKIGAMAMEPDFQEKMWQIAQDYARNENNRLWFEEEDFEPSEFLARWSALIERYDQGEAGANEIASFITRNFRYKQDEVYRDAGIDLVIQNHEDGTSPLVPQAEFENPNNAHLEMIVLNDAILSDINVDSPTEYWDAYRTRDQEYMGGADYIRAMEDNSEASKNLSIDYSYMNEAKVKSAEDALTKYKNNGLQSLNRDETILALTKALGFSEPKFLTNYVKHGIDMGVSMEDLAMQLYNTKPEYKELIESGIAWLYKVPSGGKIM